jgi:hypothetical protein
MGLASQNHRPQPKELINFNQTIWTEIPRTMQPVVFDPASLIYIPKDRLFDGVRDA